MTTHKYGMANRQKVYDRIKDNPRGARTSQIADDLGLSINEVRSHIMRLCNDGDITCIGRVDSTCTKLWGARR